MKIFIITQEEPFYLPTFLRMVLEAFGGKVAGMTILAPTTPKKGWLSIITEHYQLYGPQAFLCQGSRFCLWRLMDLLSGVVPFRTFHSVRAVARHYKALLYSTSNINNESYLEALRRLDLDVIVSINASQVFRRPLLRLPRLGCINVHGALLPRYRGRLPSFWVLLNQERETGVTVHIMNEELDDGPILAQRRVSIGPRESQHSLILKTKKVGAELLIETLAKLEKGEVEPQPNPREQATYYSFPTAEDGRKFRAMGLRFI